MLNLNHKFTTPSLFLHWVQKSRKTDTSIIKIGSQKSNYCNVNFVSVLKLLSVALEGSCNCVLCDIFLLLCVTGEMVTIPVDSWSGAEELAGRAVRERGIVESSGWTLSLLTGSDNVDSSADALIKEINGLDYVLDLIAEMELAPAFPACRSNFLQSGGHSRGSRRQNNKVCVSVGYFPEHAM